MADVETGPPAEELIPERPSLPSLRAVAAGCTACELWSVGTQTVFGEGGPSARLLLVGEQPGDREDREGKPFDGPAGRLHDEGLVEAGIDRSAVYVTNAVKHFNHEMRGKRRIHKKPNAEHVRACRPWLDAELAVVKPAVVCCLGATAAQALFGRTFRVTQRRGELFDWEGLTATATVHPSSILRAPDDETRALEMKAFVADLRSVAEHLASV